MFALLQQAIKNSDGDQKEYERHLVALASGCFGNADFRFNGSRKATGIGHLRGTPQRAGGHEEHHRRDQRGQIEDKERPDGGRNPF